MTIWGTKSEVRSLATASGYGPLYFLELPKSETEVTGEDDEAQTISTGYSKALNPADYQPEADADNYYDQFNDALLSETITETVTDAEGNTLSQKTTTIRGKNRSESTTTYETDDFGRTTKEDTITKNYQGGKWLPRL